MWHEDPEVVGEINAMLTSLVDEQQNPTNAHDARPSEIQTTTKFRAVVRHNFGKGKVPESVTAVRMRRLLTRQRFVVQHDDRDTRQPANDEKNREADGQSNVFVPDGPCPHSEDDWRKKR
jgi:hypothetical protein